MAQDPDWVADLKRIPGIFWPAEIEDPRPPYQARRITQLYLAGQPSPRMVAQGLPPDLAVSPNGTFIMGLYSAPEGWGLAPFNSFHAGFEVEGWDGVDGSPAVYLVAGTFTGAAGRILPRDYNAHFCAGRVDFAVTGDLVQGWASLDEDAGRITLQARTVPEQPVGLSGVLNHLGPDGAGGRTLFTISHSYSLAPVRAVEIAIDLPPGHRLDFLRDFRPDYAVLLTDMALSISAPQLVETAWDAPVARMEFLDTLSRMGRAVVILEQSGRIAFMTVEAEALLRPEAPQPLRLPPTLARPAPVPGLAQPALIRLPSGRQIVARAFPIALRLGHGPLAMVLLTDLRAPGTTDPEPLLRLMGLTGAEAALAALVGQGLSPAEAAARRGITQSTARSMLKAVYGKMGLRRQAELAALVTRLQSA